jgi:hypothetical protein
MRAHVGQKSGIKKVVDTLLELLGGLSLRFVFFRRNPLERLIFRRSILQGPLHVIDGRTALALDPRVDEVDQAAETLPKGRRVFFFSDLAFNALRIFWGQVSPQVFLEALDVSLPSALSELHFDYVVAVVKAEVLNGSRDGKPMNSPERVLLVSNAVKQPPGVLIALDLL